MHERGPDMMWTAHDDGLIPRLSSKRLQKSIYLPANRGAWILLDLGPERTLVAAYFEADLGGTFPAGLVRSFTKRQFKSGLKKIAGMAAAVHEVYDGEPAIYDGFAQPISPQRVLELADSWLSARQLALADE